MIRAWRKGVSEVADMTRTSQWLNKSDIKANTKALIMAAQEQALKTRAVAHCARFQMHIVQETCRDRDAYNQRLQHARRDRLH